KKNAYLPRRIGGTMRVDKQPGYAIVDSGLPTDTFNLVIGTAHGQPDAAAIARIAARVNDAGLPAAGGPGRELTDAAVARALGDAGFVADE
ncbi:N-acetyltransferase, partial [Burkholderia pseudomallei]